MKQERHGKRGYPEYLIWLEMKQRCTNPKHPKYRYYGARGIRICKRWMTSFNAFIGDLGRRPEGFTLDRIRTNGNYSPRNCRWAPWSTQRRNKRNNVWVEFNGRRMILPDWSRATGISTGTLRQRIFTYRWPLERAFSQIPVPKT